RSLSRKFFVSIE
ncbi:hypothetical protein N499_0323B, partial [Wolbachia pipientis wVitA]